MEIDSVEPARRPNPLSGLWSFLVGGVVVVALLAYAHPITRVEECPNHGGNGNASAFSNPSWDTALPLMLFAWLTLVVLEQALPITWRGRSRLNGGIRAASAILVTLWCSCCLFGPVVLLCH